MTDAENLPPRRSTRLRSGTTSSGSIPIPESSKPAPTTPLRIAKSNSKSKALATMSEDTSLRDISPGSSRRNSPSMFQIKDKVAALQTSATTKSPPTSPPLGIVKSESTSSVRNFWQNASGSGDESTSEAKRKSASTEGQDLKSLKSSYVKNNPFLAKDMRERESSPKLSMSPSQHRLSAQLGEVTPTTSPSRIPAPLDTTRKELSSPTNDSTPKASCLHSTRIKGPRQNASDSESPTQPLGRRERRKTVTFDQAPQVLEFDRRSSHGTTSSDNSSSATESQDEESRPLPSIPPRPLPQVPPHDSSEDERPASKDSNDAYMDMESRIRCMMERVVLRDNTTTTEKDTTTHEDDIFSLYTTTNEMEDDSSQESEVFSSQGTAETALSSQVNSQDEDDLQRQLAIAKQSDKLLQAMKSRPFSLAELPDLGFGDDADDDLGGGLGLREFCTPEPEKQVEVANGASTEVRNLAVGEKPKDVVKDTETITPPVTPPLEAAEIEPQTPQDQIIPPPDTLPSTPPTSPHKHLLTEEEDDEVAASPVVPEREATIRSRGGSKLRVRPSLSRQEAESIVARRRKSEIPPLPNLNDIREGSVEPSSEVKVKVEEDEDMTEFGGQLERAPVKAEVPLPKLGGLGFENDLGLGNGFGEMAVEEMERVIEAQKRGYMMRQQSKVVHASSRDDNQRAAKVQERMASSISVDWGVKRAPQNLIRKGVPQPTGRKPSKDLNKSNIPAPPQNGHNRANSKELDAAAPPFARKNTSGEYGRLFIKVIKLKDLELPLPKGIPALTAMLMKDEPMFFSCTLDNGLHCVTTPFKLLQREAKIDQEFELIATDKLEFMLTLQARINLPPAPKKAKGTLGKGAFQRIFGSPKKKPVAPVPPQKDPYHGLGGVIGRDGSFSRSYIALKTYENAAYGRQFVADIACLNEWALEPGAVVGRGREMQRMRKRPYMIGKIECLLLFVPCMNPTEELPKSMSAAVREMKNAEWFSQLLWEGYLSQQGGDCQHWRRRYFKLIGSSLVGFHESTRARRATINLAKSTRVVDDRQSLIETPPVRARGQRRKSGFACEEAEGYMYLEEGFRIWFGNGEVIDFRADTREEKREWVNVLQGVVGKVPTRKEWAEAVLHRERAMKK